MADKMMRIAGRDETGLAKPVKTDKNGNINVRIVGNIARTKTVYRAGILTGKTVEELFNNLAGNKETIITALTFSYNVDSPALSIRMFYGGDSLEEFRHKTINASGGGAIGRESLYPAKLRGNVDQLFEVITDDAVAGQYLYRLRYPITVKGLKIQVRNDSDIPTHQVALTMIYSEVE